ncbi:hypothetical protein K435DRAFT_784502 [Dendrothele bispora CBS 962.96]|uniref:Thioredoxin domain-containing protein n=1 Tax=Dendrothele bispora (strain CBS 962.96) TaxID=1314807 RepID=A0A4S8L2T1_DENBC|nr:hypothetical protein K435DRAFT_784502 [Dendrothele bispora CBS 962.96]
MSAAEDLPDQKLVQKISDIELVDVDGNKVKFGTVIADKKTIVVFIRHFFCGSCQQYVEQLASVPKEKLEGANVDLVVIGCGDWKPITHYAEETGFKGKIYAEPTRTIYHELRMNSGGLDGTPAGEERRTYLKRGKLSNALWSIWRGPLAKPSLIGKQGDIAQLGGEFVFESEKCTFAHRMKHSEDHVEVVDLMKHVDVSL